MKYSTFAGVLAWSGGAVTLVPGRSFDDDHPIVRERPELFTSQEPDAEVQVGTTVERATNAPGEVRNTPGVGTTSRVRRSTQ